LIGYCQSDVQYNLMRYSLCQLPAIGENSELFVYACRQIKCDVSFELINATEWLQNEITGKNCLGELQEKERNYSAY